MAGGVGSRFWPFSTNEKPKQFLDFFGTGRSLLQMTVQRFRALMPIENILIATNVAYKAQILEQIPDLKPENILCEPARRNTAPCIGYAMARIRAMEQGQRTKDKGRAKSYRPRAFLLGVGAAFPWFYDFCHRLLGLRSPIDTLV